ncbi:hypothetical protein EV356DRAFT_180090 [Viridothelium virens]|uniref:Uncharacterized protein n=1 Tax=Viridothelium virens TaxID=1048519 RepID=A0A6A6H7Z4_VIRVR|nr:hypothetical protein EV356DRAFT_180090 [Viridothelium virens]
MAVYSFFFQPVFVTIMSAAEKAGWAGVFIWEGFYVHGITVFVSGLQSDTIYLSSRRQKSRVSGLLNDVYLPAEGRCGMVWVVVMSFLCQRHAMCGIG